MAGLRSASSASPYLERLIDLELIERQTLPTEAAAPRPRISRYAVADPYLRFHFALVDPWRSAILLGQGAKALDEIWPVAFDEHVSRVFEDVAAQYVRRFSGAGTLPPLQAVGKQWLRAGDLDVVGVAGGKTAVAGSVRWRRATAKPGDLADLQRDVAGLERAASPTLLLFSRSGFQPALRSEPGPRLVTPADLFRPDLDYERTDVSRPGREHPACMTACRMNTEYVSSGATAPPHSRQKHVRPLRPAGHPGRGAEPRLSAED